MRLILWSLGLVLGLHTGGGAADCSGVLSVCPAEESLCRGSLVLSSPENQTKTFLYDRQELNCEPVNLRQKFRLSTVEVNGCGAFSIHSGPNGRGRTVHVSDTSGLVSAHEKKLTKVKSIKRLGCPPPKEGVAPYVIIAAISAVILVVVGVGIFFKRRKIYSNNQYFDHVGNIPLSEEQNI